MKKKTRLIAQVYHYISEGIILFYLSLLVIQFTSVMEHAYWSYLGILLGSMCIFSLLAYFELKGFFYIMFAPILVIIFYGFDYSISLSLIFAIVLTYRYYRINKTDIAQMESTYLGISSIIAILLFIISRQQEIILLLIIQFAFIFIGYFLRNLSMVSREERRGYGNKSWILLTAITFGGLLLFLLLAEGIQAMIGFIWRGISVVTIYLSSTFVNLFQWIRPTGLEVPDEEAVTGDVPIQKTELGPSIMERIEGYVSSYILIAILIIIALAIYLFTRLRRSARDKTEEQNKQQINKTQGDSHTKSHFFQSATLKQFFKRPAHPVRRLVFQFEKRLAKTKYARKPSETIEKWLERIGRGAELKAYQQVRYGNKKVSNEELEQLKTELRKLENSLV